MPSNFEETLLAIERERFPLGDLTRRVAALEQGLMASWMYAGGAPPPPPPPAAPCTEAYMDVQGLEGCCIPLTLKLVDSLTGTCTITYQDVTDSLGTGGPRWSGCTMYSRPAKATPVNCPAMQIPVYWYLFPYHDTTNFDVYCYWFAPNNGNVCPTQGKTCASAIATGRLFRQNIAGATCTDGVFGATSSFTWVNQNQVGLSGTISSITIGPP